MMCKQNLSKQLVIIVIIIFGIIMVSLGLLFPRFLLPIYENNIYAILKQPLDLINSNVESTKFNSDVAYIYITDKKVIVSSSNLNKVIKLNPSKIISRINKKQGKFNYLNNTYYYYTYKDAYVTKIALTNDNYIKSIKTDILRNIFPIMLLTLGLCVGLILLWSRQLIKKIEHLKEKIANLDNDNYVDKFEYNIDDELKSLSLSIDNMKDALKKQEEYKNQTYQNISHDFKTPITVIKSYIEGIEDGIETYEDGLVVIKEQINKLELKVYSLLYLNKLNYIKDLDNYKNELVDVSKIIGSSVEKFKLTNPNLEWQIHIEDKNLIFRGTSDMWEAIIDNLLNNFVRYADKIIKITIKNNKIIFYNDGDNIDPNVLNDIFTPYKKGIKGQFGLGLSIVKKTLSLFNYEISANNEKKGVSFIIKSK